MADKIFSPVRVRAATQEAAIDQALQMTGADREDVDFEVLEETEQGVTIRIAPRGTLAAKKEEPAPSTSTISTSAPDEVATEEEASPAAQNSEAEVLQTEKPQEEPALEPETAEEDEETEQIESAPESEREDETEAVSAPESESETAVESGVEETAESESEPSATEVSLAAPEVVEHARVLAQEMLDYMGLEAQAHSRELPDWCLPTANAKPGKSERTRDVPRAFLHIEGEDVGILIGKHGQTLQSFQYLLNLSLNNTADEEEASADGVRAGGVHVVVDAGEYRERRASALERTALDTAGRAKRERRSIRMEPMPAHERRLVHLALAGDHDIVTSSEGREPWRRVVVTPTGVRALRGSDRGEGRSGGGRGRSSGGHRPYGSSAGNIGGSGRGYN